MEVGDKKEKSETMKRILVVDDDTQARATVKSVFESFHYVLSAESAREALRVLKEDQVDLVLLDVVMPEKDGIEFLRELRVMYPDLPVIMVSAITATRTTAESIRLGAVDFITKPFERADLRMIAERALEATSVRRQLEADRREQILQNPLHTMIGESMPFQHLLHRCLKQAQDGEPLLIEGERGVGKKLLARHIHSISRRASQPFITVRCTSMPTHLVESDLFGCDESVQPGSSELESLGRLDLASSGTLALEDVEYLSEEVQRKLARFLEEGAFSRAGSERTVKSDTRVIVLKTTGGDPADEIPEMIPELKRHLEGRKLVVPSLRGRKEDVPLLAYFFLNQFRKRMGACLSDIDSEAMGCLRQYEWPGNVIELRNIIERAVILHGHRKCLDVSCLPRDLRAEPVPSAVDEDGEINGSLEELVDSYQRSLITRAMTLAKGKQVRAAKILKTTPRILNHRIKRLKIKTIAT